MSAVNPAFTQNLDARPKKVVLLPPKVFVFELSAGGVPTRMADWKAAAKDHLIAAATRLARSAGLFELVSTPPVAAGEQDLLDAHIGLYDRVAQSVFAYGRGLAFLREHTGADTALIVLGSDFISSSERKAEFAVGPLLRHYLDLAPGAADRAYVEYYLTLIKTQNPVDNGPPRAPTASEPP